jgi:hypothetical protein|tara:strand:+ start:4818 stop:5204 length:387 start_codon:yes stop_codon:yes gene_type:complete
MTRRYKVFIPGKDVFKIRLGLGEELGDSIYNSLINLLESSEEKIDLWEHYDFLPIQCFWYREGYNGKEECKYYTCNEGVADFIISMLRGGIKEGILNYGASCKKEGSNLLFQLNNGELSMKEINDNLK